MASTNDVRPGQALDLEDGIFTIVDYQHVKPGKGRAFVRMKLKNLETGQVLDRSPFARLISQQDQGRDRRHQQGQPTAGCVWFSHRGYRVSRIGAAQRRSSRCLQATQSVARG